MFETSLPSEDYLLFAETKDSGQGKVFKKHKTCVFSSLKRKTRNLLRTFFDKTHRGLRTRETFGVEGLSIAKLKKILPIIAGK